MPNSEDIVLEARKWVGTRWKDKGRTERGIDCVGLLVMVAQGLRLPHEDVRDYSRRPVPQQFLRHLKANLDEKPINDRQHGDVLVFRDSAYPCHVGIFTTDRGSETVIHSTLQERKCVEETFNVRDRDHMPVTHCFAFRGIE